ncbi:MAG TPA: argininosuccinate synthase [Saprospiraceae bacterium]|nr:argininosuccinate synthase [Saprospiraceae bacterium]
MMKEKLVLGFSGGLDTTYCAKYLSKDRDFEVHTVTVNTGGFSSEELQHIENHALAIGAVSHMNINAEKDYYDRIIKYLIYGNVLKNNSYPLSVSAERLIQAIQIAKYAKSIGAKYISHGSTGAGNDQVRFDLIFNILIPEAKVITPIRDLKLSRNEEIEYLKANGVQMNFEKAAYSINKGLWGTSVGGIETLKSNGKLPEHAWPTQVTKTKSEDLILHFERGELIGVNNEICRDQVTKIKFLQNIVGPFGIGRDIHVGDTIIGIKGRVGFEAAAPILIIKAHHSLEKHILSKWQLQWKDQLANFYGNWLHEGQILDPVMRDIEAFLCNSQKFITGKVFVTLHPYRFEINGIESEYDLMSSKFGSYGEMNNTWTGEDVKGFTKIFGNQNSIIYQTYLKV